MEYTCSKCKEVWNFYPEDYEDISDHQTKCPLCSMPIGQMLKDVYRGEGIIPAIKQLFKRL